MTPIKGVDISEHNGNVDFSALRAAGVQFVIIRSGYGSDYPGQQDERFAENVRKAETAGMPWGVYHYAYATTAAGGAAEAAHALRLIGGKKPPYGVWYDMEEIKTTSGDLAGAADAFCAAIEKAGLYAGVYANLNWWTNYLTSPVFEKYDRWCAQYYRECELSKPFGIWQYTDALVIGGKCFDGNFAYKDYPALTAGGQEEESGMSEKEIKALIKKEVAAMTSISGTGGDCTAYAETETEWCKRKGVFNGDGKGNFGWRKAITRQDAACIIYRVFERLGMLDALPDITEE